jgi:hypothetical protein
MRAQLFRRSHTKTMMFGSTMIRNQVCGLKDSNVHQPLEGMSRQSWNLPSDGDSGIVWCSGRRRCFSPRLREISLCRIEILADGMKMPIQKSNSQSSQEKYLFW